VIQRLADRFGRTGFAALASVIWAVPMAAWAGSSDLSPYDKTAYPWVALGIGVVMLVVWIVLLTRLRTVPVTPRQHRFDLAQMSAAEKRWTLVAFVFLAGLIAWLNAAATVDWGPLFSSIRAGKIGPLLLAVVLLVFLAAFAIGLGLSWRKASAAFKARLDGASAR